jgi:hypothetical protein
MFRMVAAATLDALHAAAPGGHQTTTDCRLAAHNLDGEGTDRCINLTRTCSPRSQVSQIAGSGHSSPAT